MIIPPEEPRLITMNRIAETIDRDGEREERPKRDEYIYLKQKILISFSVVSFFFAAHC